MNDPDYRNSDDEVMGDDSMYGGNHGYDDGFDGYGATQETQPSTQPTEGMDSHLWGFFQPCNSVLKRLDLFKTIPVYEIGRHQEGNNFVLPGFKVSE